MTDRLIDDSHLIGTAETFARCREVVAGGESSYARLSNTRPIVSTGGEGAYFDEVTGVVKERLAGLPAMPAH